MTSLNNSFSAFGDQTQQGKPVIFSNSFSLEEAMKQEQFNKEPQTFKERLFSTLARRNVNKWVTDFAKELIPDNFWECLCLSLGDVYDIFEGCDYYKEII